MRNDTFDLLAEQIKTAERILIFPHVSADGDTLGSSSALCMAARSLGKSAYILMHEPTPPNLDFLENECVTRDVDIFDAIDLAIMVDCSSLSRIKWRENIFKKAKVKMCIDHHAVSEGDTEFDFSIVEPTSAATGELVYMLINAMGCKPDLNIANAIFTAITTDTGNFQHSNTTKRSHDIAGSLYEIEGFDSKKISSLLYERNSISAMNLESMLISALEFYECGGIAVGKITERMLAETGCMLSETDGFIQRMMSINGVEIGCLLKETESEVIRVSMRAKSYANVAHIAEHFGGGGHVRAAGCTLYKPIESAAALILPHLCRALEFDR